MKKVLKKIWKPVVLILIYILSFYFLLRGCDFKELGENFAKMNAWFFVLALSMVFLQIYIQGLCYKVMTHSFKMKFNTLQGFGYCSIDLFFSQITPFAVGGQPIMIYEMSKRNLPASKTTTMVLLYSFLNKLALIIMAIVAVLLYRELFVSDSWWQVALIVFGIVCNLIIASISILCMFMGGFVYKTGTKTILRLKRKNLVKNPYKKIRKLRRSIKDFKESNKFIKEHMLVSFIVLLLCILKRIATFATGFFIYIGLGLTDKSFVYIIAVQTVIALVADSFPIPGGVGAYEATFMSLYEEIYPDEMGKAALMMVRGISYYFLIMVSGITTMFITFGGKKKNKNIDKEIEGETNEDVPKEEL